jgi:hypothetical protein
VGCRERNGGAWVLHSVFGTPLEMVAEGNGVMCWAEFETLLNFDFDFDIAVFTDLL